MNVHENYMKKAIDLAIKGRWHVSPNPVVGCIIVKNGVVIGEGYHEKYGSNHAEVNALKNCIQDPVGASLYVTLEPCNHFGKTPPCTDFIIKNGIRDVYISMLDPNPMMSGKSVDILKMAGINVQTKILEQESKYLNRYFCKWISKKMPYVIAKVAQDSRGYIAKKKFSVWITGDKSKENVHKLRSEVDAILVGKNTVLYDNPELTVRMVYGRNPKRIILDTNRTLPQNLKVFQDSSSETIVACNNKLFSNSETSNCQYLAVNEKKGKIDVSDLLIKLGELGITSLILEGGSKTIKSFLIEELIDEFHLYSSNKKHDELNIKNPFSADENWKFESEQKFDSDNLIIYRKKEKCLQES